MYSEIASVAIYVIKLNKNSYSIFQTEIQDLQEYTNLNAENIFEQSRSKNKTDLPYVMSPVLTPFA